MKYCAEFSNRKSRGGGVEKPFGCCPPIQNIVQHTLCSVAVSKCLQLHISWVLTTFKNGLGMFCEILVSWSSCFCKELCSVSKIKYQPYPHCRASQDHVGINLSAVTLVFPYYRRLIWRAKFFTTRKYPLLSGGFLKQYTAREEFGLQLYKNHAMFL